MICEVNLTDAKKEIRKVPLHIRTKLFGWVDDVEERGLDEVRKVPGWHDEPLKETERVSNRLGCLVPIGPYKLSKRGALNLYR